MANADAVGGTAKIIGKIRLMVAFYHVSGITTVVTYLVMVLGAYTSAIGAGLSCPDWPTCYGTWIPFLSPQIVSEAPYSGLQIFAEWFHRGLAFTVGFFILGTAIAAWYWYRENPLVVWPATFALILLPLQVILGGLTVTRQLEPIIVTGHLAVAVLILLLLFMATLTSWFCDRDMTGKQTST